MEIPPPPKTPTRLNNWLRELVVDLKTVDPSAGAGISLDKQRGVGTLIKSEEASKIPTPPTPGTYVLGAVDGIIQWLPTTTC